MRRLALALAAICATGCAAVLPPLRQLQGMTRTPLPKLEDCQNPAEADLLACAHVMAQSGLDYAALAYADEALKRGDPGAGCVASEVFAQRGNEELAQELRPKVAALCPPYLVAPPPPKPAARAAAEDASPEHSLRRFQAASQQLAAGDRYSALAGFADVVAAAPDESAPWLGYAAALEQVGASKAAAEAFQDAAVLQADDAARRQLEGHAQRLRETGGDELKLSTPAGKIPAPAAARLFGFGGGSLTLSHFSSFSGALNGRAGLILGGAMDVGADLSLSYAGGSLTLLGGVSGRAWTRISPELNLVYSAGVQLALGVSSAGPSFAPLLTLGGGIQHRLDRSTAVDVMAQLQWAIIALPSVSVVAGITRFF